jgi:hypothetical protein
MDITLTVQGRMPPVLTHPPTIDPTRMSINVLGTLNPLITFEEVDPATLPALGPHFVMTHLRDSGTTFTQYEVGGHWSGCAPVPDDSIHAAELSITPSRHRLEHDLWHHLVGIWVYRSLGSPIIWRDAHHVAQPRPLDVSTHADMPGTKILWGPADEEEWLVTALSHRLHGEYSRDHGASIWLRDNGHDIDAMITQARGILSQIPSDTVPAAHSSTG